MNEGYEPIFKVLWRNESTEWIPQSELKKSNPMELAEYIHCKDLKVDKNLSKWVNDTRNESKRIVSKVKATYFKVTHKMGIKIPRTCKEALDFDKSNGNSLWKDAKQLRICSLVCLLGKGSF